MTDHRISARLSRRNQLLVGGILLIALIVVSAWVYLRADAVFPGSQNHLSQKSLPSANKQDAKLPQVLVSNQESGSIQRTSNSVKPPRTPTSLSPDKTQATADEISTKRDDIFTPELEASLLALLPEASQPYQDQSIRPMPTPLWQIKPVTNHQDSNNVLPRTAISGTAGRLGQLDEGDQVELPDPTNGVHQGTISYRRILPNGVTVLKFEIDDDNALTGGQIVKGKISTDINVVTEAGAYTVSIDNASGDGTLIDDADLKRLYQPENDAIVLPHRGPETEPDLDHVISNT